MKKRKITYLDNAASTPTDSLVFLEMAKAVKIYGNPSSYNDCGREAREYLKKARLKVSGFLGATPEEVIFTGSGTEANNLATQGMARKFKSSKHKPHIITTKIEHPSVLKPVKWLEKNGFDVSYLSVDKEGVVNLDELKSSLRPTTVLASIMYANNEIGTIQPVLEISKIIKNFRSRKLEIIEKTYPFFHTDACQATEYLDMNVNHLGVDLLTVNGSKIYGPKGVGALYVRRGIELSPLILGGEQEYGLRAGTESVVSIGGLAVALGGIDKKEGERLSVLKQYFINEIKNLMPNIKINGAQGGKGLPNNVSISVPDLSSEAMLLELDKYGICAGSGSACTSHSVEPSHVLKAVGLGDKYINGTLRFSMGRQTTKKDIDYVLEVLPKIVKDLKKRYGKI